MSGTRDDDNGLEEMLARREGRPPPRLMNAEPPVDDKKPEDNQDGGAQETAEDIAARYRRDTETLRAGRNAEAQRAAAAERRAQQAEHELQRTRRDIDESSHAAVVSQIGEMQARETELKTAYGVAFEKGDAAEMANISSKLGAVGARLQNLEDGRAGYEATRNARLREPAATPQAPAPQAGEWTTVGMSVDQFINGIPGKLGPKTAPTAEWLRANPRFFSDPEFYQVAAGADSVARGKKIPLDSREYFDFVNKHLEDAGMVERSGGNRASGGSTAPPSVPPSRSPPGGRARDTDIVVTAVQRMGAELCGMDPLEYAKNDIELRRAGIIPIKQGR